VTDGDRGVGERAALHHERSHRLADDRTAPDHDTVRASGADTVLAEEELHAGRCTRTKPSLCPMSNLPTFTGWNPSTSFSGTDAVDDRVGSICFGAASDENAVYALIVVQLIDECEQFALRRRAREANGLTGHPRLA